MDNLSMVLMGYCAKILGRDEDGFSIKMYHNGELRGNYYVNGSVDWFNYCDKNTMSMTEIDGMVKELRYKDIINYWYSIPGGYFDGGLVKLSEDAYVLDMLIFVPDTRLVNICLEHVLACSQEQFCSQVASNIFINFDDDFGTNTGVVIEELVDNYGAIVPIGGGVSQVGEKDKKVVEGTVKGIRTESKGDSMKLRSGRRYANATDFEDFDDDSADSEDSDYVNSKNFETRNEVAPDWPTNVELDSVYFECKDYAKCNSDHEGDKNWLEFNAATDMADPKFEIGMLFTDCKVFRAAVREHSILQKRDVVFIRNKALKLKVVCGDPDCGWMIYDSKMQHENTLQVKTYVGEHTCTQLWKNPTVKSTWISKKYVETLKTNPHWPVSSFKKIVEKDYNTGVSRRQLYMAKDKALKLIEGTFNEQY
ncbi:unnamed protein product [Prunus brigantina]